MRKKSIVMNKWHKYANVSLVNNFHQNIATWTFNQIQIILTLAPRGPGGILTDG